MLVSILFFSGILVVVGLAGLYPAYRNFKNTGGF